MKTLFGIWWKDESGNDRLCELYGSDYYESAFVSRAKAESRAAESNSEAESNGWAGGYYAAPIPSGVTCHWVDDSQ